MAVSQNDGGRMEGWLYLIRSNRIGLQYSRKCYSVLQYHLLKSFKSVPLSTDEETFMMHDDVVLRVDFSRDSEMLTFGSQDGKIKVGVSELVSACAGLNMHILKVSLVSAFLEMELNC